jgi:arylsulfatase A-like enzyme
LSKAFAAALAGAAVGALLTAVDAAASLLADAPLSARALSFLAAYYVPVAAAAGLVLGLLPGLRGDIGGTAGTLLAWCGARRGVAIGLSVLAVLAPLVASSVLAGARWRSAVIDEPQPARQRDAATGVVTPNVVLIVLDAVGASSFSSYGYPRRTTPRLDAFAANAVRYTRATTVSPWSVPSHASLFTGLLPDEHGAGRAFRDAGAPLRPAPLPGALRTLAEALSQRGHATAAISANPLVAPAMNFAQGFRHFDARPSPRSPSVGYTPLLVRLKGRLPAAVLAEPLMGAFPSAYRSAEEITDSAIAWLEARDRAQPYFLFLNYMDAHTPYVPRAGFRGRFPGRSPRLPSFGLPTAPAIQSGSRPIAPDERAHLRALYDSSVAYLDHEVGRLLDHLLRQEDDERAWIIVTADHGEALGEHGRLGHDCILYQEVLAVPLIVRYPRVPGPWAADAGLAVEARPIQTVDVVRRLFRVLDATPASPAHEDIEGPRLASVDCYCAADHPRHHGSSAAALYSGTLKYIEEQGRDPLLFDLDADPGETQDLAASRTDRLAALRQDLDRLRGSIRAEGPSPSEGHERRREDALRALGYVQ